MSDPSFDQEISKRQLIVVRAILDGCNDCPDSGVMCSKHRQELAPLYRDPKRWLKVFEDSVFGGAK